MTSPVTSEMQCEWNTLHRDHERYEMWALVIKLFAFAAFGFAIFGHATLMPAAVVFIMLWILEAIWKTFQGRIADRIVMIEHAMIDPNAMVVPFQLYSSWEQNRPSVINLLFSYSRAALRPTVAFPYVVMVIAVAVFF